MFRVDSSTEAWPFAQEGVERAPRGAASIHRKCGVYTRPDIVDEILDRVGWTARHDLCNARLLEPAAGDGAFVSEAAIRLVMSMQRIGCPLTVATLGDRIRAFEIHPREANRARMRIVEVLSRLGIPIKTSRAAARRWIVGADFLLEGVREQRFSHVVGNPPYARWSTIPKCLRRKYERHLPARMAKGDLFLPFLDSSIGCLERGGRLGFVCSNRWRFMAFAEDFRRERLPEVTIESDASVEASAAYSRSVDIYPSILILKRKKRTSQTRIRKRNLTLVDAGYTVRVGPALGCTSAFVLDESEGEIEKELLAPWIDGTEISEGQVIWKGRRIISLHDNAGRLRSLDDFPRAAARIRRHRHNLLKRAIVRKGAIWYRPIDRVVAAEWERPKLVLPELAKIPRLAMDCSGAIPSHGVYAIFGSENDLERLYEILKEGGLMRALEGLAPQVKGGYFRCYRRFLEQIAL
jgi:adenine-specific DNA-methyltransferase